MKKLSLKKLLNEIISEWYLLLILGIALLFNIWISKNILFSGIAFIFLSFAGAFEFIIMNNFVSKKKKSLKKLFKFKLKDSFLWVHNIIYFIHLYDNTIYDTKKMGYLRKIFPYIIISFYIILSAIIYKFTGSFWILLIYLIPVITNTISFFKKTYFIYSPKR